MTPDQPADGRAPVAATSRVMWTLFEPIHSVTYFMPQARAAFEEAGLRGFWRGYFAGRSAPFGPVGPDPVIAAFASFAPRMVTRALPDVWQRATPEQTLRAREAGAVASLERVLAGGDGALPAGITEGEVAEAADLMDAALAGLDCTGRVLAATNAALPRPERPLSRLWRAATILREHRGDGHVAALVAHGLDGCQALVWRAGLDLSREYLQPARGWTDEEWDAAAARLRDRGWLDAENSATPAAAAAQRDIEDATDRAAAGPWEALGAAGTDRLRQLLAPLSQACYAVVPITNLLGLPTPAAS